MRRNEKITAQRLDRENYEEKNSSEISKENENSSLNEELARPPRPGRFRGFRELISSSHMERIEVFFPTIIRFLFLTEL